MNKIEWRNIFKETLFIIVASIFVAIVYNTLNPRGINLFKKPMIVSDTLIERFLLPKITNYDTSETIIFTPVPDTISTLKQEKKKIAANTPTSGNGIVNKGEKFEKIDSHTENPDEIPTVTYNQLVKLLSSKSLILIDARSPEDFKKEHIGNAINIFPFETDLSKYFEALTRVPFSSEKIIIVYCEGGTCDASHRVAQDLIKLGYKNVFVYAGGWEEWSKYKNSGK